MGIYMGVLSLEQASPFFQAITQARVAGYFIWQIIDAVNKHFCFIIQLYNSYSLRKSMLSLKKVSPKII
jgi:hypothetical protein